MTRRASLARDGEEPASDDGRVGAGRGFDLPRIERAVREILVAIGEDPDREGLRETPARVARAYAEQFAGAFRDTVTRAEAMSLIYGHH